MKDCPRCDSSLSHYALAEGEAYGCDACGWVGVDVEHRSTPATLESWHDAISRFEAKFANDGSDSAVRNLDRVRDNVPVPADEPEADPEPKIDRVPSDEPVVPTDDGDPEAARPTTDESAVDGEEPEEDADEAEAAANADVQKPDEAVDSTDVEDGPDGAGDDDRDPDGIEEDATAEAA